MAAIQSAGIGVPLENSSLFTNKALCALFLPLIAEQLLSYLVGLADSMMVSYVGEAAVAGVSVVYGVLQCLLGLIAALTTGGAVVVGQYWGAKDKENSHEAARLLLALLMQKDRPLRLKTEGTIRLAWPMLRRILRVGVPFGIENGFFYCGRVMVLSLASSYGTVSIAAGSVAGSIAVITTMLGMSVNLGMTAVISQCIGSGSYRQAKYYHKKIMYAVFAAHLLVNIVLVAALPLILAAYNLTEEVAALTARIVVWHAVMAVLVWPLAYMQPVTFRAAGDTRYPMKIGVVTMFLCRIVMSYVFGSYFGMGVMGIFMAIFLEWLVKAVLFTRYYLRGQWMRNCTIAQ